MTWDCEAYGPGGQAAGALCFVSPETGKRVCASRSECAAVMKAERIRAYNRISEAAAAGDPSAIELAEIFSSPDQLLGGPGSGEQPS
jgi:hypothetical protein